MTRGKGRTDESVANSAMLDAEDVAGASTAFLVCSQRDSRIIEIQMRTVDEPLA